MSNALDLLIKKIVHLVLKNAKKKLDEFGLKELLYSTIVNIFCESDNYKKKA